MALLKHMEGQKINECIFLASELTKAFTTLKTLNDSSFSITDRERIDFLEASELVMHSLQEQVVDLVGFYFDRFNKHPV